MLCGSCGSESGRIRVIAGHEYCHRCGDFQEAGGVRTEGLLTRNSFRIRSESVKNEGETLHPFTYDKARHTTVPNPEFIKRYPDQAHEYYTDAQVRKAGAGKLVDHMHATKAASKAHRTKLHTEVTGVGDQTKAQKRILS